MTLKHPQYISRIAFYTIPLLFITSIFAYIYNYKVLSILLFFIFITSIIHWKKLKQNSIIRFLDIFLVIVLIISSFYYIKENKRIFWIQIIIIIFFIYAINQILYYYQLIDNKSSLYLLDIIQRENVHYRTVYTHLFFNHICLLGLGIYCIFF